MISDAEIRDTMLHFLNSEAPHAMKFYLSNFYGKVFEWDKWREEIPFISFPADWQIRFIPPIAGAIVRFLVRKDAVEISVYLDCYSILGYVSYPYWEVYNLQKCATEGTSARVAMNDIEGLLESISAAIERSKH